VKVGTTWGYADRSGKLVIAPHYELASSFGAGRALVVTGGKAGIVDRRGTVVVAPRFGLPPGHVFAPEMTFQSGPMTVLLSDGVVAYVDRTGRVVWQGGPPPPRP
jgi:hypothetical protein